MPVKEDPNPFDLPELRHVEGFSDGAFAIIVTLLVLEIHRPNAEPGRLGEALLMGWPSDLLADPGRAPRSRNGRSRAASVKCFRNRCSQPH